MAKLTELMRDAMEFLGVPRSRFSLSALRAGGATQVLRTCPGNLGSLQFLGRWGRPTTLHHYVQTAMMHLQSAAIPSDAREAIEMMANKFLQARPREKVPSGMRC